MMTKFVSCHKLESAPFQMPSSTQILPPQELVIFIHPSDENRSMIEINHQLH